MESFADLNFLMLLIIQQVNSCFSSYYELRQSRPRLERLRHILDDNAFSNQSEEENQEKVGFSVFNNVNVLYKSLVGRLIEPIHEMYM